MKSTLQCVRLKCDLVIFKVISHLGNSQVHWWTFLLMGYAFWSIFKTIKVLDYMGVITGAHLSKLFLSPVS